MLGHLPFAVMLKLIGPRGDERGVLEECSNVTLVTILDAGHFTLNEKPGEIAELVLAAVASKTPRQ